MTNGTSTTSVSCNGSLNCGVTNDNELHGAKLVVSLMYFIIVGAGLFGNLLVIVTVLIDRRMRSSVTNLYILNLAAADLLSLLLALSQILLHLMSEDWLLGLAMCKTQRFLMTTALYTSVITLTAVCVERYVAIVHPMHARLWFSRRRALASVAACWALGSLLAGQSLAFLTVRRTPPHRHLRCHVRYAEDPAGQARAGSLFAIAEVCLFYFAPLGLQVVLYTRMGRVLFGSGGGGCASRRLGRGGNGNGSGGGGAILLRRNTSASVRQTSSGRHGSKGGGGGGGGDGCTAGRKQVVKMLIACVAVYFICYLPKLLEVAFRLARYEPISRDTAVVVTMAMVYANSAVNPLLYTVFSSNFRRHFRQTFRRCLCRKESERGQPCHLMRQLQAQRIQVHLQSRHGVGVAKEARV